MKICKLIFFLFLSVKLFAQQVPIGSWQSHFTYNKATSVEKVNDKIFCANTQLWSYSLSENNFETYSKVNGLSDINIQHLRYDPSTKFLVIVYENSNIDLMQDNNFYNIPDIKNLKITGSKIINNIYFKNQKIYFLVFCRMSLIFDVVYFLANHFQNKCTFLQESVLQV